MVLQHETKLPDARNWWEFMVAAFVPLNSERRILNSAPRAISKIIWWKKLRLSKSDAPERNRLHIAFWCAKTFLLVSDFLVTSFVCL